MAEDRNSRQQKAKMRARRRRRRRAISTLLFVLILLLSIFAILSCTVLFPIKNVSAKGSRVYSSSEILKAAGITEKDNVLAISREKTEQKIRRKLPFVDNVQIERSLPDSVTLKVTDAKECCAVQQGGKFYTLSARGYVIESYDECPQNTFALVVGQAEIKKGEMISTKDQTVMERSGEIQKLLYKKKIKINLIDVSNPLDIKIRVEDKFDVLLGDSENLENKVAHLVKMMEEIGDRKGSIDLSKWAQNNTQGIFKAEK